MSHELDPRKAEPFPELPTLGARLRWARQRAALTQAELARRLGKRQQYMSSLEQDRIESPARAVLAALAAVLEVSPAWLVYGMTVPLTEEEITFLQSYRQLGDRDRALVRLLVQELRCLAPTPESQSAPLSASALRLAQQWERLSPEGQAAIQAALQALLAPPER